MGRLMSTELYLEDVNDENKKIVFMDSGSGPDGEEETNLAIDIIKCNDGDHYQMKSQIKKIAEDGIPSLDLRQIKMLISYLQSLIDNNDYGRDNS